jgi:hypothetical protein
LQWNARSYTERNDPHRRFRLSCLPGCLSPACEKQNPLPLTATAQPPAEKRELPPPGPKVEACSLLSKEEVAAIQKATITDLRAFSRDS